MAKRRGIPIALVNLKTKTFSSFAEFLHRYRRAFGVPIVAVAASDVIGLKNERTRFQDFWDGSSVHYEPDVAAMLNPEQDTRVLLSIEKNPLGPTWGYMSFRLCGEHFAFDPVGKGVDSF